MVDSSALSQHETRARDFTFDGIGFEWTVDRLLREKQGCITSDETDESGQRQITLASPTADWFRVSFCEGKLLRMTVRYEKELIAKMGGAVLLWQQINAQIGEATHYGWWLFPIMGLHGWAGFSIYNMELQGVIDNRLAAIRAKARDEQLAKDKPFGLVGLIIMVIAIVGLLGQVFLGWGRTDFSRMTDKEINAYESREAQDTYLDRLAR